MQMVLKYRNIAGNILSLLLVAANVLAISIVILYSAQIGLGY